MNNTFFAGGSLGYAPVLIRVTGILAVLLYVFDFLRRRSAAEILSALKEAGATSPESAVCLSQLKTLSPMARRMATGLLKSGAPLRRVVGRVKQGRAMQDASEQSSAAGDSPVQSSKAKAIKGARSKGNGARGQRQCREDVSRLRFFVPERGEGSPSLPFIVRDGGERSVLRLVVGIVLALIATEAIVFFFPQLKELLTAPGNMFN